MTTVLSDSDEIFASVGSTLGTSDWIEIDQARIDAFADTTDDHQWIHVDPERAKDGPFGATIAHGYLTLSLLPHFNRQNYLISGAKALVNYGSNKVRFITPVRVGSRLRATTVLTEASEAGEALNLVLTTTVEIEREKRPALVAETISRVYF